MLYITHFESPLGKMFIGASDKGICLFDFEFRKSIASIMKRIETQVGEPFVKGYHPYFDLLVTQVTEYFNGVRKEFDLPLHLAGTSFQVSVWNALMAIPYGETRSYKAQSIAIGNLKAIRAVAGANGENGIAIIVPCHRVVGENGDLTGYGGGLPKKKWLLEHENKYSGNPDQMSLF